MDLELQDRVFVVTGASRGLGRASAEALVQEGARVVLTSRTQESVDQAVADLNDASGRDAAVGVCADNADETTPARLIAAADLAWGRLDGALISVGGPPAGSVSAITDDQWASAFFSVFLGAIRIAREVSTGLPSGGSIAFVLSSSVRTPLANMALSNGLRPGLAMVAKTMAEELGPRGVRVNALLPGRISTERVAELDALSLDPALARAAAEASIPLGRYGEPEEFARAATFLLSPAASFVSGVMIPVDGGFLRAL